MTPDFEHLFRLLDVADEVRSEVANLRQDLELSDQALGDAKWTLGQIATIANKALAQGGWPDALKTIAHMAEGA